jgi:hemoglobin-like flavoprotein
MNPDQIFLVQRSFEEVRPGSDDVAEMFYDKLFEIDPSLRSLFKSDLREQGRKLMQMISVVVNGLNRPETIIPTLQDLGRRHAGYGVQSAHYQTVGEALLWTLEQGLKERFTEEVRLAWVAAYEMLAQVMSEAAAKSVAAPG